MEYILSFDNAILNFIQTYFKCAFLDTLMPFVSVIVNGGALWIILAVVFFAFKKTRKIGFGIAIALIIGLIFANGFLKPLVARIRPFDANLYTNLLIEKPTDFSFPSGHTLSAFESASVMFYHSKKWGICFYIYAFLVAFSRLYLYVHYPTDVIFGIVFGIIIGILSTFIVNKICKKYKKINFYF